jgi:hypothetical protein
MKLIKFIAAAAISAAFAAPATAAVMGAADLNIKTLAILTQGGMPLTDIAITSELRSGSASVNFNGVSVASPHQSGGISANVDVDLAVAGPSKASVNAIYGGSANNNTSFHLKNPTGNFALADMKLSGSAVDGTATGFTRADASIVSGVSKAGATSTIANSAESKATFTVAQTVQAQFAIEYDIFVKAYVGNLVPTDSGQALSSVTYTLSLTELGEDDPILFFSPAALNRSQNSTGFAGNKEKEQAGWTLSSFVTLVKDKTYNLVISQKSEVILEQKVADVPEPSSLFLSALGLLAVGAGARRRLK